MSKLRLNLIVALATLVPGIILAQSPTHRPSAPTTDEAVVDLQHSGGYTLMRGFFYQAGQYSGSVVALDPSSGEEDNNWPKISGEIYAIISDGNGGYYAGGSIRGVDNEDVGNLIHILPNKTLDRGFLPNPSGVVFALTLRDNILYVGGTFVTIGDQPRSYAASFDVTNGELTAWAPHPDNRVTTITVTADAVYLAGAFSKMNNAAVLRSRFAAVNKADGTVLAGFNLTLEGSSTWSVNSMVASSTSLYIGGSFDKANETDRNGLVEVSLTDGTVNETWDPSPQSTSTSVVHTLALNGSSLFVGGSFDSGIGGDIELRHLGMVSTIGTGNANSSFNPEFDVTDRIYDIRLAGTQLFVLGNFNEINGITRLRLASLNVSNGVPNAWSPELRGSATMMAVTGSIAFVAGDLYGANWTVYNGLAILQESTNNFWPHTLELPSGEDVQTMRVNGNVMYLGGDFTSINGVARKNLAAIDLTTGAVLPWNPGASGTTTGFDDTGVFAMEIHNNTVYIAGRFLNAGGQPRRGLAAIDAVTGSATTWNPSVGDGTSMDEYVLSMTIHNNSLFVAGTFTSLAGEARPYLGAIDMMNGNLVNWHPDISDELKKVRVAGNAAYILGDFSAVAGVSRPYGIAAIDINTGEATSFNPEFNSTGTADIAITETDIYVAGYYSTARGEPRPGLSSFSLATGLLNNWNPDVGSAGEGNFIVESLAVSGSRLYVGGGFIYLGNENRGGYAEYDLAACTAVADISLDGSTLLATPGDTYQWYENDILIKGATSSSYEINVFEYGKYAVVVTSNGCSARSEDYIYLITDHEDEQETIVRIYPNPVLEDLFIEVAANATLEVYDHAGKKVSNQNLGTNRPNRIETVNWNESIYLLKVRSSNNIESFKIFKTN